MAKPDHITYWVTLTDGSGEKVRETILEKTPGRAARAAEALHAGFTAKWVTICKSGVCARCGVAVWAGSTEAEMKLDRLICGDC